MALKTNDIPNVQYEISVSNLENIFNVYEDENGKYFYNILKTINMPKEIDPEYYDIHVVSTGEMWPTLAYKYYKNVDLWWLVCIANEIQNATENPKPGDRIKIIKRTYVPEVLNKITQ